MSTEADNVVDTGAEVAGTEADKINTGALGTLVAVGLLAMITITAAVTALVRHDLDIEEADKATNANQIVTTLKESQREALNGPAGYVDRGKGVVSLPIELAKGLVVSELEHNPSSATPPPPPPADAGAVEVTAPAVDGSAAPATLVAPGASSAQAPTNKPVDAGKTAEPKKAPTAASSKPTPAPTAAAATPGAKAPEPTNK